MGKVAEFQKLSRHQPEFSQEPHQLGGKPTPAELLPEASLLGAPALSYINRGCQQQSDCSLKGFSVPAPLTAPGSEKKKGEEVKQVSALCLHRDGTSAKCSGPETKHSCPSRNI